MLLMYYVITRKHFPHHRLLFMECQSDVYYEIADISNLISDISKYLEISEID